MSFDLNQFSNFQRLPDHIKNNLRCFYISETQIVLSEKYIILLVTNDDKVYGFGANSFGKLGFGHNNDVNEYTLNMDLSDHNICDFFEGFHYMFAKSNENEVYSWGENLLGQLGVGNTQSQCLKPRRVEFFDDKKIIDICCGYSHCLALTSDGQVYGWGDNNHGQICGTLDNIIRTPALIDSIKEKAKFIHCYPSISFVVTVDGLVYSWGYHKSGKLGHKMQTKVFEPTLIGIENMVKVICDSNKYSYFLDIYGTLYQCGNSSAVGVEKIEFDYQVKNIHSDKHLLICQTDEYVYKLNKDKFEKTQFRDFYEYFTDNYGTTHKTIQVINGDFLAFKEIYFDKNYKEKPKLSSQNNTQNMIVENLKIKFIANDKFGKFKKRFREPKIVGAGTFGKVFRVYDNEDHKYFAVKRIDIFDQMQNIISEIQFLFETKNDFVVQLIDAWIEGQEYAFVQMEYCPMSLKDVIEIKPRLFNRAENESINCLEFFISCEILIELTECLHYLHSLTPPIIHRDLKPGNVLMGDLRNGRSLRLCDFGLSKIHDKSDHSRGVGTFKYMAPEIMNSRSYNLKADVYSLGIISLELFDLNIESLQERDEQDTKLKYNSLKNIICRMIEPNYRLRPKCDELLDEFNEFLTAKSVAITHIYSINREIMQSNNILKDFIIFKLNLNSLPVD